MPQFTRDAGAWKQAQEISIRDAGAIKRVFSGHIKDAGVWKVFHIHPYDDNAIIDFALNKAWPLA